MKLSRFLPQLELNYKCGCQNKAEDALSRVPVKNHDVCVVSASDEENKVLISVQAEQRKDGELSQIINYLEDKSLLEDAAEANTGKNQYICVCERYSIY